LVILLCVLLLAVTGAVLVIRGRRKTGWSFAAAAATLFLSSACGPLPRALLHDLQTHATAISAAQVDWSAHAAIVVLGVGLIERPGSDEPALPVWAAGRLVAAAELHEACRRVRKRCPILLSGGAVIGGHTTTEAELMADQLANLGVARDALLLENRSRNTWQNAQFSAELLRELGATESPILLTSAIHVERASKYFEAAGISVAPSASDFVAAELSALPSSANLMLADVAAHEYAGMARFRLYEAMGWNARGN